jgi:oligopeptide transport system substrate-binding protein
VRRCSNKARLAPLLLAALLALSVTSACKPKPPPPPSTSPATQGEQPVAGGVLAYDIGAPAGIAPYTLSEPDGAQVSQAIFDSLVQVDPLDPTRVLPSAADTWTVSADGLVWTFGLNQKDTFHEGTPVTANDFIYAWNRIVVRTAGLGSGATTVTALASKLASVEGWDAARSGETPGMTGLKALDGHTLEVTLSQPYADFVYVVADPALAPVPKKYVEEGVVYEGKRLPYVQMPIGNGAFKMSAPWKHGEDIKVVRNGDYYAAAPFLDALEFHVFLDTRTAYTRFLSGEIDFARVPADQIESAEQTGGISPDGYTANPGKQTLRGGEYGTLMLAFNNRDPLLSSPKLRAAISLAINRRAMCDGALDGAFFPADNIVPKGLPGYEAAAWTNAKYDPKRARAALAAAGFPSGRGLPALTLLSVAGAQSSSASDFIAASLAKIGVRVTVQMVDETTFRQRMAAGAYQLSCYSRHVDAPTIDDVLYSLFRTGSAENLAGYSSSVFDRGIASARATNGRSARMARYRELNRLVQASDPVSPLAFCRHSHVASSRVRNLVYGPQNIADFSKVWVSGAPRK